MTSTALAPSRSATIQDELDRARRRGPLNQLVIPPSPAMLVRLQAAMAEPEPDLNEVARIASSDVAMAATLLRSANSALHAADQHWAARRAMAGDDVPDRHLVQAGKRGLPLGQLRILDVGHALVVDQPGSGEALRLQGLTARFDTEHWASRVVDWLEQHPAVDPKRIGCEGVSLGGYYCPRAVAMEPRFAAGVCWGANHDWRDVQKRRLEKEGDFPVPHYWAHVMWVWGAKDMEEFMRLAEDVHLDGVVEKIRVPFLVTHGEKDSQIPLKWAHRTYEQLVNSPKRELKVFTEREGGVQHSSFDNSINAGQYIADWVAETLGGRTAA